eukprot:GHVU01069748.1.p2 GENE.GHVU01069748.1~~GHVU01069748.1.p2  ORF type:complete len:110 (-),score=18.68 GHVU01069748.1:222-551(-)
MSAPHNTQQLHLVSSQSPTHQPVPACVVQAKVVGGLRRPVEAQVRSRNDTCTPIHTCMPMHVSMRTGSSTNTHALTHSLLRTCMDERSMLHAPPFPPPPPPPPNEKSTD